MTIDRKTGHAPLTDQLVHEAATMRGRCLGCPGCTGLCAALIEAMTLPDAILARGRAG